MGNHAFSWCPEATPESREIVVLFVGTHERQLDEKGRLALPASFRTHLGEHCYLVFGDDQCVNVVPSAEFETMAHQLIARVERGELSRQRQRAVSSSASMVAVDKQGRVMVDDKLRAYADLTTESRVIVAGNFTKIEIWSPERFARINEEGTSDLAGEAQLSTNDSTDSTKQQKEDRGQTTPMTAPRP